MQFLPIGLILIAWIALMAFIAFKPNTRLVSYARNIEILLPLCAALAVWMWIMALVIWGA
ncbi:MAG: hypothetical protein AAF846_16655 [Chloroflexota bacterium]